MATQKIKTAVIDNFSGELTSDLIGTLNSGLQPIAANPYGKLPFANSFKVKGLQFIEDKYALTGSTPTQVIVPTIKSTFGVGSDASAGVFGVDLLGELYIMQVSDLTSVTPDKDKIFQYPGNTGTAGFTLAYGGGAFYDGFTGTNGTLVVGTDAAAGTPVNGAWYMNGSGNPFDLIQAGSTFKGIVGSGITWTVDVPRPFCKFLGTLYMANGSNIIAFTSNYQDVVAGPAAGGGGTGGGWLKPGLPPDYIIRSMQVSNDGRYMIMVASNGLMNSGSYTPLNIYEQSQQAVYQPIDTVVAYWNGSDATVSTEQFFKGLNISAVVISSTNSIMFGKDIDGVGIFDLNGNELARIEDVGSEVYPPSPHNIDCVGRFFFFMMQVDSNINIYMFDASTNKLYPLYSDTGHTAGSILGALLVPTLHGSTISSATWKDVTRAKLYYFIQDAFPNNAVYRQYAIHLQNYGGVINGNYATQVEEFGHKIRPVEVRVYTLPMSGTQGFTLQLVDAGLNQLINKTYTYAAGSNPTLAQGPLTKIPFGVQCKAVSGLGFALQPSSGSLPFFVEKVEIDYLEVDNPPGN